MGVDSLNSEKPTLSGLTKAFCRIIKRRGRFGKNRPLLLLATPTVIPFLKTRPQDRKGVVCASAYRFSTSGKYVVRRPR